MYMWNRLTQLCILSTLQLQSDILTRSTQKEHQAQTLYSANDYIQHTEHAERYVCADPGVLETFPELDGKLAYDGNI